MKKLEDLVYRYNYIIFEVTLPEIKLRWEQYVYQFLEYFDPSPKKKNKETDLDWHKRIDIKYALRHAEFFYKRSKYTNKVCGRALLPGTMDHLNKKSQKAFKKLAISINGLAHYCEENYKMLLMRKRTLEQMENDSN